MEELNPDSIKEKNKEEKEKEKNIIEDIDDTKINEKNIILKKEDSDSNILDPKKELEKIRASHIQKHSFLNLFIQSFIFSKSNMQLRFFNFILKIISNYIDIKIPVVYGKLLNAIIKEKNYTRLCSQFRWHIFFLFIRLIIKESGEIFGFYVIGNSLYQSKTIVLENIAKKDSEFFDLYRTGEIVDGIKKNEKILEKNFFSQTLEFGLDIFKFFYLLLTLKNISFRLMIYFFIIQLLKFGCDYLIRVYTDFRNRKKYNESANKYNSSLNEFISNIKLIKSLGLDELYLEKLNKQKLKYFKTFCNINTTIEPILELFNKVLDTFITFLAGKYAINGIIDYSDITIFQNYTNQLKKKFHKIRQFYKQYIDLYYGWKRFFDFFYFEPKVVSTKNYIPEDETNFKYNFELKNVKFSYPARPDSLVYKNLSLKIEDGKTVALVGYSGGGKSTLVNLIQRLYDPLEGEIFLNNINLKEFHLKWLRQKIGCVFQETNLLYGSIQDNITIGLDNYDPGEFKEICRISNLDFIKDKTLFPHGYKTLVGERGGKLSGGQKQRIAIARALMRNIKVLILDEATSALDSKNEKDLQIAIEKITKLKHITTIIIAHRLSTVKNADEILFLDKGEIIERGTHKELIEKKGEYYKLVQNQLISKEIEN